MPSKELHLNKTLTLLEAFQIDKNAIDTFLSNVRFEQEIEIEQNEISRSISKGDLKKLNEILSIEKEKFLLRDSKPKLNEIQKKEINYYNSRKSILNQNLFDLRKTKFILSPLVQTYESDWGWIVRPSLPKVIEISIKNILNSEAKEHYFLFQRSYIYDYLLDTNILEFPLNEYQYFFLRLFEVPQTIAESANRFYNEFEYESKKEKRQLMDLTQSILRELIFRMFIVEND